MIPTYSRSRLLAALLLLGATARSLDAQPSDTTHRSTEPLFTARDAYMAAGFAAGVLAMHSLDRYFADRLQDSTTQSNRFLHHQATNVRLIAEPGAMIIGGSLYLGGKLFKNSRAADLGLHGTEAIIVGGAMTSLIKGVAGRARPLVNTETPNDFKLGRGFKVDSFRSFPSGHSLTGFAAAAAVTAEASRWWPNSRWYVGTVMYGGATLIGLSRMYNNKHWASDVVMGAAIGTFSGLKIVKYHHSHPGNRIDKWLLGANISPGVDGPTLAFSFVPPRRIR